MSAMADPALASPIPILRLSSSLRRRLDESPLLAGRVHSVFEQCLNVQWRDESLLALHGPGPLAAPFAASLSVLPGWRSLGPGTAVWNHGGRLRVGPLLIDTGTGASVDCSVPPSADGPEALAEWLSQFPHDPCAPALSSATGRLARERLAAGIRHDDASAFLAGARPLIGLGEGLTPAGDDCLVGALAALWRFAPYRISRQPAVRQDLARAASTGTTTVAREFILHALDGRFSELVIALLTARSPEEARRASTRLVGTGATSGADTLAGLRLALQPLSAARP